MMIFVGGRERTEREFDSRLDLAGFRMARVIPTISTLSLIEAVVGRGMNVVAQLSAGISAAILLVVFPWRRS